MGFKLGWTTIVFNGLFTTAAHVQNRMRSATRSSHPQNELLRLEYGMPQHWVAIRWNNEVICWRHTGQPVITMSAASSRHGDTPKSCRNQPRSEVLCESVLCYPHWYGTIDIDWYATMCYNKIKIEEPRGYTGTLLLSVEETTGRSHRRVSNWLVEGLIRYENHTNRNPMHHCCNVLEDSGIFQLMLGLVVAKVYRCARWRFVEGIVQPAIDTGSKSRAS